MRILPLLLLHLLPRAIAIGAPEQHVLQPVDQPALESLDERQKPFPGDPETHDTFPAFLYALDVLQGDYFAIWQGLWPTGIDWTSAVIGTYVSSSLSTISSSYSSLSSYKSAENLINTFFSQLVSSYFGQDAFALRQEAYDDMLWVVLGWLESIKFINKHSEQHYEHEYWYGQQWIPAFAHRARLFWDLASQGWNTTLCGGGMIWSPYLEPYKNAITNELFISASISMYLYFPGDENTSPFSVPPSPTAIDSPPPGRRRDPKYLAAAVEGYKWLKSSNMTDALGLYVDGYHISGWTKNNSNGNTKCDARNEMVYTYNQGVLLSGQRGLYEATGARSYLEDGHALIRDVIAATGWDLANQTIPDRGSPGRLAKWQGLGRGGVMEDTCDRPGSCSQDGHTFKGIFFQHLTQFCAHLPEELVLPDPEDEEGVRGGLAAVRKWHDKQCARYGLWIKHNARAALSSRNGRGRFGTWWGAPRSWRRPPTLDIGKESDVPAGAVDYRNQGVPDDWQDDEGQKYTSVPGGKHGFVVEEGDDIGVLDLNDRGRGRTLETQGGGVSVLRAAWELVDSRSR